MRHQLNCARFFQISFPGTNAKKINELLFDLSKFQFKFLKYLFLVLKNTNIGPPTELSTDVSKKTSNMILMTIERAINDSRTTMEKCDKILGLPGS